MPDRRLIATVVVGLLVAPVFAHVVLAVVPGFASFIVVGGSMEPTIGRGSLVYVQDSDDYRRGDVISFPVDGRVVTHRIVDETDEGYVTKGDANEAVDGWRVPEHRVVGEVVIAVPAYGYLLGTAGTRIGYVLLVVVPGLTLIALEVRHLLRKLR